MGRGVLKKIHYTNRRIRRIYRGCEPDEALVHGVAKNGEEENTIVLSGKEEGEHFPYPKQYIEYPESPGLGLFDHDKPRENAIGCEKALETYIPGKLINVLAEIFPPLADAATWTTPSTSSCIYDNEGNELRGPGAGSYYFFAQDASDVPRILNVLGKKLWIAGYGRIEISRSGSLLPRIYR